MLFIELCNAALMSLLLFFIPGGKPTNGGSASWSPGSCGRTMWAHRRPADPDFKPEVKKSVSPSSFPPLHLNPTIPNHHELNFCSSRCIWSLAISRQTDVPRFREKTYLLRAHIESSHLKKRWHKLKLTPLKTSTTELFSLFFLVPFL